MWSGIGIGSSIIKDKARNTLTRSPLRDSTKCRPLIIIKSHQTLQLNPPQSRCSLQTLEFCLLLTPFLILGFVIFVILRILCNLTQSSCDLIRSCQICCINHNFDSKVQGIASKEYSLTCF